MQLIEQGKLKFDDTLGALPDIEWNNIDRDVTVKQLLNHTSGVPDRKQSGDGKDAENKGGSLRMTHYKASVECTVFLWHTPTKATMHSVKG